MTSTFEPGPPWMAVRVHVPTGNEEYGVNYNNALPLTDIQQENLNASDQPRRCTDRGWRAALARQYLHTDGRKNKKYLERGRRHCRRDLAIASLRGSGFAERHSCWSMTCEMQMGLQGGSELRRRSAKDETAQSSRRARWQLVLRAPASPPTPWL